MEGSYFDKTEVSNRLKLLFGSVRNLRIPPPAYVYTISPQRQGISAVDVDRYNLNLAYSFGHSPDIYVKLAHDSLDLSGDFADAWARHTAAKNTDDEVSETKEELLQVCTLHHGANITGLQFTPDGNLLFSCALDKTVKAWRVSGLQLAESYNTTSGEFTDIHISDMTPSFVTSLRLYNLDSSGSSSSVAALYNFEKKTPTIIFEGHTAVIECVRFHPNGLYIATSSADNTIKLWCSRTAKLLRNFEIKDSHDEQHPKKLTFSPDGKCIACAYSQSIKIWDIASGKVLKVINIPNSYPILNLSYDGPGKVLATGGSNKILHMWDVAESSSQNSDANPETKLMKCENLDKTLYCIKYTSGIFTCVTA